MTTTQRRSAGMVTFLKKKTIIDSRGNPFETSDTADVDNPDLVVMTPGVWWPNRGSKASVPGQQEIDVYNLDTKADLPDVNMWSKVLVDGEWYDIIAPPQRHRGTRHVRHWTWLIKVRPDQPEVDGNG